MAKNIPSICMWNKKAFYPFDIHKNFLKKLHEAGIVIYEQKEFLSSINKFLYSDEWFSKEIQFLRNEFCQKFAYRDNNWRKTMNNIFLNFQ